MWTSDKQQVRWLGRLDVNWCAAVIELSIICIHVRADSMHFRYSCQILVVRWNPKARKRTPGVTACDRENVCIYLLRKDWKQCNTMSLIPKQSVRICSRIWWSTMSNAALRSNSTSRETRQSLTGRTRSLWTMSTTVCGVEESLGGLLG